VVLVVVLGLAVERYLRGQDRELCPEMVIPHYERSSWFAMNAERYADHCRPRHRRSPDGE
jgi:hypothetical protein